MEKLFSSLLNETNMYQREEKVKVERLIWGVSEQLLEQALKSMKANKAPGPSGVTRDLIKAIEQEGEVPE